MTHETERNTVKALENMPGITRTTAASEAEAAIRKARALRQEIIEKTGCSEAAEALYALFVDATVEAMAYADYLKERDTRGARERMHCVNGETLNRLKDKNRAICSAIEEGTACVL